MVRTSRVTFISKLPDLPATRETIRELYISFYRLEQLTERGRELLTSIEFLSICTNSSLISCSSEQPMREMYVPLSISVTWNESLKRIAEEEAAAMFLDQ